jgi:hypothetical protein
LTAPEAEVEMHKRLLMVGAVLVLLGAVMLAATLGESTHHRSEPPVAASGRPADVPTTESAPVLSIGAGLCLAAGAALVGIGANRWYAYRERTTRV